MVVARIVAVLLALVLWFFGIFDVRAADSSRVRGPSKRTWQAIVLLLPVLGTFLWLRAGRPSRARPGRPGTPGVPPEYDRPGRARASNPDDDAQFLEQVRRRAEEQRRKARERQEGTDGKDSQDGTDGTPTA